MQEDDNMSVTTMLSAKAIKWNRPSMTFWLIFQKLVTHVTGCILHVDPPITIGMGLPKILTHISTASGIIHSGIIHSGIIHSGIIHSGIIHSGIIHSDIID